MTDTFSRLGKADVVYLAGATSLVSAGTDRVIVRHIRVVNQSSSNVAAVKMWQAGTSNADLILPTADITGGGWAEFEGTIILNPSDILYVQSVAPSAGAGANLTVIAYGLTMN